MRGSCQTEGCRSFGIAQEPITTWEDEEGNSGTVDAVICGYCGQPITEETPPQEGTADAEA